MLKISDKIIKVEEQESHAVNGDNRPLTLMTGTNRLIRLDKMDIK
jgi:hypothetical protein